MIFTDVDNKRYTDGFIKMRPGNLIQPQGKNQRKQLYSFLLSINPSLPFYLGRTRFLKNGKNWKKIESARIFPLFPQPLLQ